MVGEKIVLAFEEGTINNIGPVVTPTNPGNVGDVLVLTITAIDSGGRFTMSGYPSWPPCTFYGLRVGYVGVNPSEIDFRITGRQFRRGANLG